MLKNHHIRSAHQMIQPENLDEEDEERNTLLGLSKIDHVKKYTANDF